MTKEELEQAIKDEAIIFVVNEFHTIGMIDLKECFKPKIKHCYDLANQKDRYYLEVIINSDGGMREVLLSRLFKTKAQAQHYLDHANIERTEKLPFFTFEEIKKIIENEIVYYIDFVGYDKEEYCMEIDKDLNTIGIYENGFLCNGCQWELTEENFYKAYDECVKLFKEEE